MTLRRVSSISRSRRRGRSAGNQAPAGTPSLTLDFVSEPTPALPLDFTTQTYKVIELDALSGSYLGIYEIWN